MEPNMLKSILLLVFRPRRFTESAAQEVIHVRHAEAERQRVPDDSKSENFPLHQTRQIRSALFRSAVLVLAVVVAGSLSGLALGMLLGPPPLWMWRVILYSGIAILLWATLAKGGWSIRSFGGQSLPERVEDYLFRVLHSFGSFLLVLSATWQGSYFS